MFRISRILEISILCFSFVYGVGGSSTDSNNATWNDVDQQKNYEILENLLKQAVKNSLMNAEDQKNENFPSDALNGVYTECALALSFPCLQKKLIVFLYKLDKMKSINLIGKTVFLVRKTGETASDSSTMLTRVAEHVDRAHLKDIIDNLVNRFFENHSLRVRLPEHVEDSGYRGEGTYLDIDFGSTDSSNSLRESKNYLCIARYDTEEKGC